MAAFTSAGRGRVFISYRRADSAFPAGWLYDRLCAHLGSDNVFKDVDSIDPGDDFDRVIGDAVGSCQVLLALIGDRWLDITDGTGHRRLDDPEDFVRLEIEAALRRDVRVIPILVGRAPLPSSEQLPDSLRGLIRRQAIELSPNRFEPDVARLVRIIDKTLAAVGEGPADAHAPVDRTSRWQGPPAEGHGNLLADPQWIDASNAFSAKRPKAPVGKLGKIWDTIKNQPLASAVVAGLIILAATLIANQYIGSDDSQHRTPAGTTAAFAAPPASRQIALNFTGTNFLLHPAGVAVDDNGTVYVADHDHDRVLKLAAGSDTPTQMLQFTGLAWPSGVAADTHGGIYVADSKNNRVLKLAAGSDTPTPLPFDGLNGPLAVAVDNNDAVYVADTLNRRVLKLAAGSTTQDVLPFITPPLVAPVGVAVDGSSNVYVTDVDALRVYKLSSKVPRQQSELFSYSGLRGPKGVAVDRAGNVYVTDSSNRVLKLAANNSTPAPLAFTNLDGPTGVAVDNSNGNVYVADWGNNLVLKLPPK